MPQGQPTISSPEATRDLHLDVFRGLALSMIFINHLPGTVYEHFTTCNFGFSDAVEGFVMMSGLAAALAYAALIRSGGLTVAIRRCLLRAFTLYWVHIPTTVLALAISAGAARFVGLTRMLEINNFHVFLEDLTGGLVGVPLLTHQLGYLDILPLFCVLFLAAPLALLLAQRAPRVLLAGSLLLWCAAGLFRRNLPNFPTPGGWFFNPLSWQVLFVLGLLTGLALKESRRLCQYGRGFSGSLAVIWSSRWPISGCCRSRPRAAICSRASRNPACPFTS
jgi:hypothetical protein